MALLVDSDGVLWAGTRAAGLNQLDAATGTFRRFRHDPQDPASVSADGITAILEDSRGTLWIGTFGGGLNRFDSESGTFTRFRNDPNNPRSISNDRVLVLFEDSGGAIWAGTYGGGLNRLDPGTGEFTHIPAAPERPNGLSGNEIYMIREDARGDLWIAAKGAGLNRWAASDRDAGRQVFQRFTELDGLPSATIYSGVWDTSGVLWLSTAHGLSKLDIETLEFTNYDTSHGLQGDEFNLAAGFRAAGVAAGLKASGAPDVALVVVLHNAIRMGSAWPVPSLTLSLCVLGTLALSVALWHIANGRRRRVRGRYREGLNPL